MNVASDISSAYLTVSEMALQFGPVTLLRPLSPEEFDALAARLPDMAMERDTNGTTTIMSPVKRGSGRRENRLNFLLNLWNEQHGHGEVYGPNGTYLLPDGAIKMPDASWISPERLRHTPADDESYIQCVPDFVAEIRSQSDRLNHLQEKMALTWMANGVRLGWLIDPYERTLWVYRTGRPNPQPVAMAAGQILEAGPEMPGFEVNLGGFL